MNQKDLWGLIEIEKWQETPCIRSRLAEETDVKSGRAVFYLKQNADTQCKPFDIEIPHLALWSENKNSEIIPGVIVQAEHADGKVLVGFRPLAGGNVVGLLEEFKLVNNVSELNHVKS
jgi:hypothetical protein